MVAIVLAVVLVIGLIVFRRLVLLRTSRHAQGNDLTADSAYAPVEAQQLQIEDPTR
jgi:hypothetical protein